jgi:ANTAR domain
VDQTRAARIQTAIAKQARRDGEAVTLVHICRACAALMAASGVSLMLAGTGAMPQVVCVTGELAERLAEIQITCGEGPALQALASGRLVLALDLDSAAAQRRWPAFAPQAHCEQVQAVLAIPLRLGAIIVGVLETCWDAEDWNGAAAMADALGCAEAALLVLLSPQGAWVGAEGPADLAQLLGQAWVHRWAEVHQATGVIAVQLGVDLLEAFTRLRAQAWASDRGLRAVARDVLAHRLYLVPDHPVGPGSQGSSNTEED